MSIKLMIGGDLVPTNSNEVYFERGDMDYLFGKKLVDLLSKSDFSMFNLEVPLTDSITPISKSGPNLAAKKRTIKGLKLINPYFFTLANNHILDQGYQGLFSTIELLNNNDIKYAGAGKNLVDAKKPYIIEIKNIKIGIYCCAEHEFTIAGCNTAGANPFDPLESYDDIYNLKLNCDYVVVLYHGGKEHYRYPSPMLQKYCRKFIKKGADLVICQHSHCIGSMERYINGTIVYGQGNFLFDYNNSDYWKTSLLIEVELEESSGNLIEKITYHPIVKFNECVKLAEGKEKDKILEKFYERSNQITNEKIVISLYDEFAKDMLEQYLYFFSGKKNILFRILNKITNYRFMKYIFKVKYRKKEINAIQNFIECEAHRELILKGLKMYQK